MSVTRKQMKYWSLYKTAEVIEYLSNKYNLLPEKVACMFYQSKTYQNLKNLDTEFWGESCLFLVEEFEDEIGIEILKNGGMN